MKSYGQFCPLAQAAQILCERWTILIIREFIAGSDKFTDLQKGVPLMSPTLLSTRLKQLQEAGIIRKSSIQGEKNYQLTEAGKELKPIVEMMGAWGHRWAKSNLDKTDLSASLLMWDMRRTVNASAFPKHKVVVQFHYPDAPPGAQNWWLISEHGEVDLCLNDLGVDVDVYIESSLADMTAVWICDDEFNQSVKAGKIKAMGDPKLVKNLQNWIQNSQLSSLGEKAQMPQLVWE